MKMYLVKGYYDKKIEPAEVERATDASVWIEGRRHARLSEGYHFYATFEEAKAYLIEDAQKAVATARRSLELANARLGNAKGVKQL